MRRARMLILFASIRNIHNMSCWSCPTTFRRPMDAHLVILCPLFSPPICLRHSIMYICCPTSPSSKPSDTDLFLTRFNSIWIREQPVFQTSEEYQFSQIPPASNVNRGWAHHGRGRMELKCPLGAGGIEMRELATEVRYSGLELEYERSHRNCKVDRGQVHHLLLDRIAMQSGPPVALECEQGTGAPIQVR